MIHFGLGKRTVGGGGGGGGGGTGSATISFNPPEGVYSPSPKDVTVSVTGATKLRWRIDNGAYTTVNAASTVVSVPLSKAGHILYGDALNTSGVVLASKSGIYSFPDIGGGGQ